MKIIFSSISRLFLSYSKFLAGLVLLSSTTTYSHSSELPTYLECNSKYYELTGYSMKSHYNVRTKKFKYSSKISSYTNDFITFDYGAKINRNNGKWTNKEGKEICILRKISIIDLPQLNSEGKLF